MVNYPRGVNACLYPQPELPCLCTRAAVASCRASPTDPLGTALPRGQGLSSTVTSPPDFPSDKPNKLCFFILIGQLTWERQRHGFFFPYCVRRSCKSKSNVKWKRGQEFMLSGGCPSPPRITYRLKALPMDGRETTPCVLVSGPGRKSREQCLSESRLGGQGVNVKRTRDPLQVTLAQCFMSQVTPILSERMGFLPQRWGLGAQEGSDLL